MENLLEVKNLQFSFRTYGGVVKAVLDVSFEVRPGEECYLSVSDETESGTAWIL